MTIKEWRKKFAKLDVIKLGDNVCLWNCPHCKKQFKITYEQVCHMIANSDEPVLCEECDKLALFVIKRGDKYLYFGKDENDMQVKRWTSIIADSKIFVDKTEAQEICANDTYQLIRISHPELVNDFDI